MNNKCKIYIASESEWDEWNNFNSMFGNIFQSKEFAIAYKESGMKVNLVLIRENQTNKIIGGCYYMIPLPKLNKFFNQLRIVSGPIILNNDPAIIKLFLNKITEIAKREKVITIPLRTEFIVDKQIFNNNNFTVSENPPTMSYVNNLGLPKEDLWKKISKTQKKKIKRAKKNNLFIKQVESIEDLKTFNHLYQNFAASVRGWVPIPYDLFLAIHNNFKQNAKFLIVMKKGNKENKNNKNNKENKNNKNNKNNIKDKDIPLAAGLFLLFNKKIIYLANGSDIKYKDYHANSVLIWYMMEYGHLHNYDNLDIYGVFPKPSNDFEKGMNFFKSQFGGDLIEKFMYTNKTISPKKLFIFQKIISPIVLPIYKRIKK